MAFLNWISSRWSSCEDARLLENLKEFDNVIYYDLSSFHIDLFQYLMHYRHVCNNKVLV